MATTKVIQKAVTVPPDGVPPFAPGGLWDEAGLRQQVINAMGLTSGGLAARLPAQETDEDNPIIALITGVGDDDGDEADGVCDDPPSAGLLSACRITAPLGRFSRQSKSYDIDSFGRRSNRGVWKDLRILGGASAAGQANVPSLPGAGNVADIMRANTATAMFEVGVAMSRLMGRKTYTGNPTNNTSGGGYREFKGLELLVNTGYTDAISGSTACPAVDSVVVDFDGDITGEGDIVGNIAATYLELKQRAALMGLEPVTWAIAMRGDLFYALTAVWPCSYLTNGCAGVTGLSVNANDQIALRDRMRSGSFLLIDGDQVEVVIDPNIPMTQPDAVATPLAYSSDIYFVPLTVLGRIPVTFWEFLDYDMAGGAMDAARLFDYAGHFRASDNGRFLWHSKPPVNFCVQVVVKTEPRLMMLAPHLAARITGLSYSNLRHFRSPWTDEPGYPGYVAPEEE